MLLPPFDQNKPFFRGNLHGHSTASDGKLTPEEAVAAYKHLGYDFTCLSEHFWHHDWCVQKVLDTRHLDDDGFTTIPSVELHANGKAFDANGLWHIVANGLPLDFELPREDESGPDLARRAADAGAFISIAHPEWYGLTTTEAESLDAAHAVEIYNYGCDVDCDRAYGIAIADHLLNIGRKITFTATDDSHFLVPDFGGGWVWVAAETNEADKLVQALKDGYHYSSQGPQINSIDLSGDQLTVECSPAQHVFVMGLGSRSLSSSGNI